MPLYTDKSHSIRVIEIVIVPKVLEDTILKLFLPKYQHVPY